MATPVAEGRAAQYREMMERIDALQARYKGVRGELLAKVRAELMELAPNGSSVVAANATPPEPLQLLPSCRACGRGMKATGGGTLVCQNGHTRFLAG